MHVASSLVKRKGMKPSPFQHSTIEDFVEHSFKKLQEAMPLPVVHGWQQKHSLDVCGQSEIKATIMSQLEECNSERIPHNDWC